MKRTNEIADKVKLALALATGFGVDEAGMATNLKELDIRNNDDRIRVIDALDRVCGIDASIEDGFEKVATVDGMIDLVARKYFKDEKQISERAVN